MSREWVRRGSCPAVHCNPVADLAGTMTPYLSYYRQVYFVDICDRPQPQQCDWKMPDIADTIETGVPVLSHLRAAPSSAAILRPLILAMPPYSREEVLSSTFNVLDKDIIKLLATVVDLFKYFKLEVDESRLLDFVSCLPSAYFDNPFHCLRHGLDVFFIMAYILDLIDARRVPALIASLLTAALGHDLLHPGTTKLVMIDHPWAQFGESALEKGHFSVLYRLISGERCFSNQLNFNVIRHAILATDMTQHHKILDSLPSFLCIDDECHWPAIGQLLLKVSDLGNVLRPIQSTEIWAMNLKDEAKLPGPICKIEVGFISAFVLPLFQKVTEMFPQLSPCCHIVHEELQTWQQRFESQFGSSSS